MCGCVPHIHQAHGHAHFCNHYDLLDFSQEAKSSTRHKENEFHTLGTLCPTQMDKYMMWSVVTEQQT